MALPKPDPAFCEQITGHPSFYEERERKRREKHAAKIAAEVDEVKALLVAHKAASLNMLQQHEYPSGTHAQCCCRMDVRSPETLNWLIRSGFDVSDSQVRRGCEKNKVCEVVPRAGDCCYYCDNPRVKDTWSVTYFIQTE